MKLIMIIKMLLFGRRPDHHSHLLECKKRIPINTFTFLYLCTFTLYFSVKVFSIQIAVTKEMQLI